MSLIYKDQVEIPIINFNLSGKELLITVYTYIIIMSRSNMLVTIQFYFKALLYSQHYNIREKLNICLKSHNLTWHEKILSVQFSMYEDNKDFLEVLFSIPLNLWPNRNYSSVGNIIIDLGEQCIGFTEDKSKILINWIKEKKIPKYKLSLLLNILQKYYYNSSLGYRTYYFYTQLTDYISTLPDYDSEVIYLTMVMLSDEQLLIKRLDTTNTTKFWNITKRLPLELQSKIAWLYNKSSKAYHQAEKCGFRFTVDNLDAAYYNLVSTL